MPGNTSINYLILWLLILLLAAGSCQPKKGSPPNIILITIDDLGWTDLGCYGSTYYESPQIDRLAEEGIMFSCAYAAAAVCSPSRAAIQTGKYPVRTGITDWIRARFQGGGAENPGGFEENPGRKLRTPQNPFHLELDEITLAEMLKRSGYVTCHIGKWHLGTDQWFPEKQGYDQNLAGCDYGQPPGYFDPYISYPSNWQKDTIKGFPTLQPRREGEYLTDREAWEAVQFIRNNSHRPFFLNLCHYAVHTPIQAKTALISKYQLKTPSNQKSPAYAAMVESVDEALGKIRQVILDLNLENQTLLIFTSDNGGLLTEMTTSNEPLRSGKGYPYEGGLRIPTIIWWPEHIQGGVVIDEPIISMDFFPTICEVAGIQKPDSVYLDGISLLPLMVKGEPLKREKLFWHFPHYREPDVVPYSIIRKGDWKLIRYYEGKEFELYNLKEDLPESRDRAGEFPEMVSSLNQELQEWLKETGAFLPEVKALSAD